jgi:hypothetical protein
VSFVPQSESVQETPGRRTRHQFFTALHLAGYCGILQADAYAGFKTLYQPDRKPGPITEAGCWAHARRKFFELADIAFEPRNRKQSAISPIAFVRELEQTSSASRPMRDHRGFSSTFDFLGTSHSLNGSHHAVRFLASQRAQESRRSPTNDRSKL